MFGLSFEIPNSCFPEQARCWRFFIVIFFLLLSSSSTSRAFKPAKVFHTFALLWLVTRSRNATHTKLVAPSVLFVIRSDTGTLTVPKFTLTRFHPLACFRLWREKGLNSWIFANGLPFIHLFFHFIHSTIQIDGWTSGSAEPGRAELSRFNSSKS